MSKEALIDDIASGVYRSKLTSPGLRMRKKYYVYNMGEVLVNGQIFDRPIDVRNLKFEWERNGYAIQEVDVPQATEAEKAEYEADVARLLQKFKEDLTMTYGMTGHPKADILYERAAEVGDGDLVDTVYAYEHLLPLVV